MDGLAVVAPIVNERCLSPPQHLVLSPATTRQEHGCQPRQALPGRYIVVSLASRIHGLDAIQVLGLQR